MKADRFAGWTARWFHPSRGVWWWGVIGVLGMIIQACNVVLAQASPSPPKTVQEWLLREHRFLRRYLVVVQQAAHDYMYGYKTPTLLMPVAIDLFTGYVAPIHEMERGVLYETLRPHLTTGDQLQTLHLLEVEQREQVGSVQSWQRELDQVERGKRKLSEVATDTIDYLGRLINRHLVLQEERLFPLLELLSPAEHTKLLNTLAQIEQSQLGGSRWRLRYEQLLSAIEQEIQAITGRIW